MKKKPTLFRSLGRLCDTVWNRLKHSKHYRLRHGEETLTDSILLNILLNPKKYPGIRLRQTQLHDEPDFGTDWEWWFGNDHGHGRWQGYAIQAKKLSTKLSARKGANWENGGYSGLNKKVAGKYQYQILEDYVRQPKMRGIVPLYAFYNHIKKDSYRDYWHCCQQRPDDPNLDKRKLGFTITPLANVRDALSSPVNKTFAAMHHRRETLPVRCFLCPNGRGIYPARAGQVARPVHEVLEIDSDHKEQEIYLANARVYTKQDLDEHFEELKKISEKNAEIRAEAKRRAKAEGQADSVRRGRSWHDDGYVPIPKRIVKFHTDYEMPD